MDEVGIRRAQLFSCGTSESRDIPKSNILDS